METDLYKLTMQQALLHRFPSNRGRYRFMCRNTPLYPLAELRPAMERQFEAMAELRFQDDELEWLAQKPYLKPDYIEFLRMFRLQPRLVTMETHDDKLLIEADGPQVHSMPFEIYTMATVNELYFRRLPDQTEVARQRLANKVALLKAHFACNPALSTLFEFFDFGLRRRYGRDWHDEVVATLAREVPQYFKGTSNLYLAKKYGLAAIGTMAHEYLQTFQAVGVQLAQSQIAALEAWVQEYRGELGIALTDVVGMDAFLRDFDRYFAKLYDGLRHDSGNPYEWGEKALAHYAKLRVPTAGKRLVFSDGLDVPEAIKLYQHFGDRIQTGFGIGTNLTNDTELPALNLVMKLVECNGQPVAKLSDSPGKTMCDDQVFLAYLRQVFGVSQ